MEKTKIILICVYCKNAIQAKKIGKALLKKKLTACANIIKSIESLYFWPPSSNKMVKTNESVLILKSFDKDFKKIEGEILKLHSYEIPLIFSLKIDSINKSYLNWLKKEINLCASKNIK